MSTTQPSITVPYAVANVPRGQTVTLLIPGLDGYGDYRPNRTLTVVGTDTEVEGTIQLRRVDCLHNLVQSYGTSEIGIVGRPYDIVTLSDLLKERYPDDPAVADIGADYMAVQVLFPMQPSAMPGMPTA